MVRILLAASVVLALSGCAAATKYLVQGGPYKSLCESQGGTYDAAPNGSCPDFIFKRPK